MKEAYLGDVCVLGAGVSGRAVVEYLAPMIGSRVNSLTVMAGVDNEKSREWASSLPSAVRVVFEEQNAAAALPDGLERFDLSIASPGISAFSDMYESAQKNSYELIGEIELAFREAPEDAHWVAITGTNGKTTTTALISYILSEAGLNAQAVGNIGDAAIKSVAAEQGKGSRPVFVTETSSYQLASIKTFSPDVAVILGITPDHVKWHHSFEHYKDSKLNVLRHLRPVATAVIDAINDETRQVVRELKGRTDSDAFSYVPIGAKAGIDADMRQVCGAKNAAFCDEGDVLVVAIDGVEHRLCAFDDMKLRADCNKVNALAAASAALSLGVDEEVVTRALKSFAPLEHRIEPCGTKGGVDFYNDSKATNVDATLQALPAFLPRRPIVLLGGDDKGTSLEELVESVAQNASRAICFGQAGPRFAEALAPVRSQDVEVELIDTFANAFARAVEVASVGDVVLLSPACASFDEFSCFEERGQTFKDMVAALV